MNNYVQTWKVTDTMGKLFHRKKMVTLKTFLYVSFLQKLKKSQNQSKRRLKKKRSSKIQSVILQIEFTLEYAVFKNTESINFQRMKIFIYAS